MARIIFEHNFMNLIDYTHPTKVSALKLPLNRRSHSWYLRLDELQEGHPYHSYVWGMFRYPVWLEGGSAWVQAQSIVQDMEQLKEAGHLIGELRPVVGSDDPAFDEALAQAIKTYGYRPLVAELTKRLI